MFALLLRWLIVPVVFALVGLIPFFRDAHRSSLSLLYPIGALLGALLLALKVPTARTRKGAYNYGVQALVSGIQLVVICSIATVGADILVRTDPTLPADPKRLASFVGLICGLFAILGLLGEKYGHSMAGKKPHDDPHA